LFGVLVGVLVVFFLEWLETDIIRTSEDVERASGVAVLAAIPPFSDDMALPTDEKRRQLVPRLRGTN
jgi:capsular polysaccharide biosynthesis protein